MTAPSPHSPIWYEIVGTQGTLVSGVPMWGNRGRCHGVEARLIFPTVRAAKKWYRWWNDGDGELPNESHTLAEVEVYEFSRRPWPPVRRKRK